MLAHKVPVSTTGPQVFSDNTSQVESQTSQGAGKTVSLELAGPSRVPLTSKTNMVYNQTQCDQMEIERSELQF